MAGLYWFTYRLFEMPITLLGDATRRVFYQRAAELYHKGEDLTDIFLRTTGGLTALVALPVVVLIIAGPWLYAVAFGDAWREAGVFAQWIVIWWAMRFISLPAMMLVPVLNLQRQFLVLEIVSLIPRFLVLPAAAWIADVDVAIAAYRWWASCSTSSRCCWSGARCGITAPRWRRQPSPDAMLVSGIIAGNQNRLTPQSGKQKSAATLRPLQRFFHL